MDLSKDLIKLLPSGKGYKVITPKGETIIGVLSVTILTEPGTLPRAEIKILVDIGSNNEENI